MSKSFKQFLKEYEQFSDNEGVKLNGAFAMSDINKDRRLPEKGLESTFKKIEAEVTKPGTHLEYSKNGSKKDVYHISLINDETNKAVAFIDAKSKVWKLKSGSSIVGLQVMLSYTAVEGQKFGWNTYLSLIKNGQILASDTQLSNHSEHLWKKLLSDSSVKPYAFIDTYPEKLKGKKLRAWISLTTVDSVEKLMKVASGAPNNFLLAIPKNDKLAIDLLDNVCLTKKELEDLEL